MIARQDCGTKHLRLAALLVTVVLAVCGAMLGHSLSAAAGMDTRMRIVEQNDAANTARFVAISQSLERLEKQISRLENK